MNLDFLTDTTTICLIIGSIIGMVLDFASGFANAAMHHEIDSTKMRLGLWHKMAFCGCIILAIYVQWLESVSSISSYLGFEIPSVNVVCICICVIEITSIVENLKKMNPLVKQTPLNQFNDEDVNKDD